jgi:hypothetical protein
MSSPLDVNDTTVSNATSIVMSLKKLIYDTGALVSVNGTADEQMYAVTVAHLFVDDTNNMLPIETEVTQSCAFGALLQSQFGAFQPLVQFDTVVRGGTETKQEKIMVLLQRELETTTISLSQMEQYENEHARVIGSLMHYSFTPLTAYTETTSDIAIIWCNPDIQMVPMVLRREIGLEGFGMNCCINLSNTTDYWTEEAIRSLFQDHPNYVLKCYCYGARTQECYGYITQPAAGKWRYTCPQSSHVYFFQNCLLINMQIGGGDSGAMVWTYHIIKCKDKSEPPAVCKKLIGMVFFNTPRSSGAFAALIPIWQIIAFFQSNLR